MVKMGLPFKGNYAITQRFGAVYTDNDAKLRDWRLAGQPHQGVDFALPKGTNVLAAADGIVKQVRWSQCGFGVHMILSHGSGIETLYAHLLTTSLPPGTAVERGQILALSGSSGYSTGPHLHFGVLRDGTAVDPLPFIADPDFSERSTLRAKQQWQVTCDTLNVRSGPGLAYAVTRQVYRGANLSEYDHETSNWVRIGEMEWVAATYRNEPLMKVVKTGRDGKVAPAAIRRGSFGGR